MKYNYTFTDMSEGGRSFWAATHPDTTVVGFGKSKFKACRHLKLAAIEKKIARDLIVADAFKAAIAN